MRADLGAIYDDTITVINKLDAKDSALKQDSYFVTTIEHCMWADKVNRTVQSDGTVNVATSHQVQIPEAENYLPYREWRKAEARADSFTLRTGDYVVRGKVKEEITASTIKNVMKLYEPDAFQIQAFRDATKGKGFEHSTDGILRFAEMYYVEG